MGFIDLLGFSASLAKNWGGDNDRLPEILDLKGSFVSYSNSPDKAQIWDRPLDFKIGLHNISDSFIVTCTVPSKDDGFALMTALCNVWSGIAKISSFAANSGFAVRGGVEFGELFIHGQDVIGPAFGVAYELESRVADGARVILGPSLMQEIGRLFNDRWLMTRGFYFRTSDGLIAFRDPRPAIDQMKKLQALAPSVRTAAKYDSFFEVHQPSDYHPAMDDWFDAAAITEAKLVTALSDRCGSC